MEPTRPVLAAVSRESRARLLSALIRRYRDIDLAEDALQEALARALTVWPTEGIPRSPEAWLSTVAKRAALDSLRRDRTRDRGAPVLWAEQNREPLPDDYRDPAEQVTEDDRLPLPDDRLSMLFTSTHPDLAVEDRMALTLRFVAGLTTTEISHLLLMPRPTLQQRITRAKKRIRSLGLSFEPPAGEVVRERIPDVRRVIYLIYTEGFARSTGETHLRDDLTSEAVRLAELLHSHFPDSAETTGLLSLLYLSQSRRPARTGASGVPVPLRNQDRGLWDRRFLEPGIALAETAAAMEGAGAYAVQAAIAAVHAEAKSFDETDWEQIAVLYRMLGRFEDGALVKLGLAVAMGRAFGPEVGIRRLEALSDERSLADHRAFHVARAMTLEELGRRSEAADSYRRALAIPGNDAEETFLLSALDQVR